MSRIPYEPRWIARRRARRFVLWCGAFTAYGAVALWLLSAQNDVSVAASVTGLLMAAFVAARRALEE